MVGTIGFEPTTSSVSRKRSNQLSYAPTSSRFRNVGKRAFPSLPRANQDAKSAQRLRAKQVAFRRMDSSGHVANRLMPLKDCYPVSGSVLNHLDGAENSCLRCLPVIGLQRSRLPIGTASRPAGCRFMRPAQLEQRPSTMNDSTSTRSNPLRTAPNLLTLLRICMAPFLVAAILGDHFALGF